MAISIKILDFRFLIAEFIYNFQLTELKGKNFEKENEMRNRLKEVERLHDMKVDNLNRKVASLLKEIAVMKKSTNKKSGGGSGGKAEKEAVKRENLSPKEEIVAAAPEKQSKREPERDLDKDEKSLDRDEERSDQERGSVHSRSASSSPSSN